MEPEHSGRIIELPSERELTLEEAEAGDYVFALGPEDDTIYAFAGMTGEEQRREWAMAHGFGDLLERTERALAALPEVPSTAVDEEAARANEERIFGEIAALALELGKPIGSRDVIDAAHKRGIIDSAILFRGTIGTDPEWPLTESCPNVPRRTQWPDGARSCRTRGYDAISLYAETEYGPKRSSPTTVLFGRDDVDVSPGRIRSVFFTPKT